MTAYFSRKVQYLNRNPVFRFISSVKLAVPLLLSIAATVAWGTIVESKYNAEMAKIVVYDSPWFAVMMMALWINILTAAVSRFPWRFQQIGFVTTHFGMLTLLAGGLVTSTYGIDGSMAVTEGGAEDKVALSQLVVGVAPEGSSNFQTVEIQRTISEQHDFSALNKIFQHLLTVDTYLPFAEFSSTYEPNTESNDVGLSFNLKSQFFNVSEFLHSNLNPRMQMGPATLELVTGDIAKVPRLAAKPAPKPVAKTTGGSFVDVTDAKNGRVLASVPLEKLRKGSIQIGGATIRVKTVFRNAQVSDNKLVESPEPGKNAALELMVQQGGQEYREILFARFPDFSISKDAEWKLKFTYRPEGAGEPEVAPPEASAAGMPGMPAVGGSNVVRFTTNSKSPDQALVELFKGGKEVLRQVARVGETVQTPWMGMQLTIGSIIPGATPKDNVKAIEAPQRENLPTGAVQLKLTNSGEKFWLPEGQARTIESGGRTYSIYFGRKIHRLPFRIELEKFSKKDYPGTETAMSFESDIKVTGQTQTQKISMNEPMYRDGFTVYQSSFQLNPNGPATSIFSVNQDPGRPIKYLGSLICCLGIVAFVIMRSSVYRRWRGAT